MKTHSTVSLIDKSYHNGENRDIFSFFLTVRTTILSEIKFNIPSLYLQLYYFS